MKRHRASVKSFLKAQIQYAKEELEYYTKAVLHLEIDLKQALEECN